MTRDEITNMAKEAGFLLLDGPADTEAILILLHRFAALVAAAEREAILSKATKAKDVDGNCAIVLVADIRARSQA